MTRIARMGMGARRRRRRKGARGRRVDKSGRGDPLQRTTGFQPYVCIFVREERQEGGAGAGGRLLELKEGLGRRDTEVGLSALEASHEVGCHEISVKPDVAKFGGCYN